MSRLLTLGSISICFLFSTGLFAAIDNRGFLDRAFMLAADSLIDKLALESEAAYLVVPPESPESLAAAMIARLHERGYRVFLHQDTAEVFPLECETSFRQLEYENVGQGLFRQGRIKRSCVVGGLCRLLDARGHLLRNADLKSMAIADTISFAAAEAARWGDGIFAPEMPATLFQRVVEPTLVVGITGTLVYLFFASR